MTARATDRACVICGAALFDNEQHCCSLPCRWKRMEARARERFWTRVEKTDGGCWLWTGARAANGYGRTRYQGRDVQAHRMAWLLSAGSFPAEGLDLCHTCDVRHCVNPFHMFVGTRRDNMQDAMRKGRVRGGGHFLPVVCRNGHTRTPENTRIVDGVRSCLVCRRATDDRKRQRRFAPAAGSPDTRTLGKDEGEPAGAPPENTNPGRRPAHMKPEGE